MSLRIFTLVQACAMTCIQQVLCLVVPFPSVDGAKESACDAGQGCCLSSDGASGDETVLLLQTKFVLQNNAVEKEKVVSEPELAQPEMANETEAESLENMLTNLAEYEEAQGNSRSWRMGNLYRGPSEHQDNHKQHPILDAIQIKDMAKETEICYDDKGVLIVVITLLTQILIEPMMRMNQTTQGLSEGKKRKVFSYINEVAIKAVQYPLIIYFCVYVARDPATFDCMHLNLFRRLNLFRLSHLLFALIYEDEKSLVQHYLHHVGMVIVIVSGYTKWGYLPLPGDPSMGLLRWVVPYANLITLGGVKEVCLLYYHVAEELDTKLFAMQVRNCLMVCSTFVLLFVCPLIGLLLHLDDITPTTVLIWLAGLSFFATIDIYIIRIQFQVIGKKRSELEAANASMLLESARSGEP